jgi:hypothetical protein
MIDIDYRPRLADAIEAYLQNRIDNFELDAVLFARMTNDLACIESAHEMSRFLDDYKRHRYTDRKLSPVYERGVERWIAFLRTPIEWPLAARPKMDFFKALASVFQRNETTAFTNNPYWTFAGEAEWRAVMPRPNSQIGS